MNKKSAQKLVQETLQGSFDKERFVYLVKNILNHVEEAPFTYKGNLIFDDFADSIRLVERVGKYQSRDEKLIDILIVHLAKKTSLERARTKQRNFVAKYLKGSRGGVLKDAALVAFVAPNGEDWRFSLVKMEYKFNENGKVEEEFTPARRYSFLVGKNENSHTAQSRLLPLLLNDEVNPTLEELEETFSVERVTKEFFEKYRDLFLRIKESLDAIVKRDAKVRADFKEKNIDTVDFAKKLLGQIVFLYFLQKKGWFGVERGKAWGSGSKHFLRELFEKKHGDYENFFNDILEPLFYEALRLERPGDYYSRFKCRIPFLNGGLFDPLGDYDWWNTDILLPDDIFSNVRKTKEGDIGDGVLDIFDRYNFTVKEDEPLEKEVAVDPEMLGKVFENLLEVKDRKSKGTYYTPREIVHYMCQESLANYLATELEGKVSKEDIETLIKYGESVVEHDSRVASKGRETERYSFKLPASVRKHAKLIDEKLASIRVCDPAVGSGAFPVGMMNEIIRTRNALTPYIGEDGERTPYHFKRHAIQNCLYGVDIDPGAVEIAKLRLWLSLVVYEEERETIQPLPNLDYKIMQGNSLVELVSDSTTTDQQRNKVVNEMKKLKDELFNITSPEEKKKKRNEIEELIKQLFEYDREKQIESLKQEIQAIKSQGRLFEDKGVQKDDEVKIKELEAKIQEIRNIKVPGPEDHFEWHINFSEIFQEKGGFDVVIANPPYVRQEKIKDQKPALQKYELYNSTSDLYVYFYEQSYNLLKNRGILTFISSNKWMRAKYGEKLRQFFKEKAKILQLIDFNGHKVFEATVDTNIIILQKESAPSAYRVPFVNIKSDFTGENLYQYLSEHQQSIPLNHLNNNSWSLVDEKTLKLKQKIEAVGTPLKDWDVKIYRGIITGFNQAFIIDTPTKERLCREDPKSAEILKPILRGRDIGRYYHNWAGLWIILASFGSHKYLANKYPAIYKHLLHYENKLKARGQVRYNRASRVSHRKNYPGQHHWLELDNNPTEDYLELFEKEKIVWAETAQEIKMAFIPAGIYLSKTCFLITGESLKYIQAITNSRLLDWYTRNTVYRLGTTGVYLSGYYLESIPIPKISKDEQHPFIDLVDKILVITKDDDYLQNPAKQAKVREYEKQIDQLVYELYGLTKDEIRIVEGE